MKRINMKRILLGCMLSFAIEGFSISLSFGQAPTPLPQFSTICDDNPACQDALYIDDTITFSTDSVIQTDLSGSAGDWEMAISIEDNTIDADDLKPTITLDSTLEFDSGASEDFIVNLTDSGDFRIQDNSNDILFVKDDGTVGIGTTAPSSKLEVDGDITVGDGDWLGIGSSAEQIVFDGTNDDIAIMNADVGIGTTDPQSQLEIYRNAAGQDVNVILNNVQSDRASTLYFYEDTTLQAGLNYENSTDIFHLWSSDELRLGTGYGAYSYTLTIDDSGNVGIGTTAPSSKLEVNGDITVGDGDWLGIGSSAEQIIFDGTNDDIAIMNADVGIGTTVPDALLDIEGSDPVLQLTNPDTNNSANNSTIDFFFNRDDGGGGDTLEKYAALKFYSGGTGQTDWYGNMRLFIGQAGSLDEIMSISGSGGVTDIQFGDPPFVYGKVKIYNDDKNGPALVVQQDNDDSNTTGLEIFPDDAKDALLIWNEGKTIYRHRFFGDGDVYLSLSGGKCGIGTTDPVNKLDVEGAVAIGENYSGTSTAPTDGLIVEGNVGIGTTAPGTTALSVNATIGDAGIMITPGGDIADALYIVNTAGDTIRHRFFGDGDVYLSLGAGECGIGTSSPSSKLHVSGDLYVTGAYRDSNNSPGTNGQVLSSAVSGTEWLDPSSLQDGDWTIDAPDVYRSTGNVGIGTTDPAVKLQVTDADVDGTTNEANVHIVTSDSYAIDKGGSVGFTGKYNTGGDEALWSKIKGAKENATDGNYAGYLSFHTRPAGDNVSERMRVSSEGNVGIGTQEPEAILEISQEGYADLGPSFLLRNDVARVIGNTTQLAFANANSIYAPLSSPSSTIKSIMINGALGDSVLTFSNYDGSSLNEYMRIDEDGNVGIGTTDPQNRLDVDGSVVIGSGASYAGSATAPADGLLVEDIVGIGLTSPYTSQNTKLDVNGKVRLREVEDTDDGYALVWDKDGDELVEYYTKFYATTNGVGFNTTDPATDVHIRHETDTQNQLDRPLILHQKYTDGSSLSDGFGTGIEFDFGHTGTERTEVAYIQVAREGADNAAQMKFQTRNGGSWNDMVFSSSGKLGVGTTSPSYELDVEGTADMTTLSIGGTAVTATAAELNYVDGVTSAIQTQLDAKAASADVLENDGSVELTADWDIGDGIMIQTDTIRARDAAGLALYEDGGSGLFIEDGGNVGIGTTTPDRTLTVDGEIQIQASGTDKWHLSTTGSGHLYFTETGVDTRIKFLSGGTVMPNSSKSQDLGSDSWPWDDVYADDYTTKCDWVDPQETDVVSAVMNIDFEMITKGDGTEIAHLDHATMPEFVRVREKLRHPDGTWKGAYWKDGQKVTLGSYEMDGEVFYPENDRPVNAQAVPEGAEWIGEYTADYQEAYSINKMQVLLIEMVKEQQLIIEEQQDEIDVLKNYLGME